MRPQALLMIALCLVSTIAAAVAMCSALPAEEAHLFLSCVRRNDYQAALREFGDNTCHCAPEGGYGAFLRYDQAHDPSLAFLMGTHFRIGKADVKPLPYNGEKYLLPWDKPEDTIAFVPITFPQGHEPMFLPLDMAFGKEMRAEDVKAFCEDPSQGWMRAFTLRLRTRLKGAQMTPPKGAIYADLSDDRKLLQEVLPKDAAKYIRPADAGMVKLADGRVVTADAIAERLPRLKSITIGMKIVRRGLWHRWTVKKIGVQDIIITANGKIIQLKEPGA